MQGFQVTFPFFTEEGRHRGRKQVHVWLMEAAKSLGITREGLHKKLRQFGL